MSEVADKILQIKTVKKEQKHKLKNEVQVLSGRRQVQSLTKCKAKGVLQMW